MNARSTAEEVTKWYHSQLDTRASHSSNIRRLLHGPVLSLTHGIVTGRDGAASGSGSSDSYTKEEEKKCSSGDTHSSSSGSEDGSLDKSLWGMAADCKAVDDLYHSLGRRHRARLDAFIAGVELAAPSEEEDKAKTTPSSPSSPSQSPVASMESLPESKPVPVLTAGTPASKRSSQVLVASPILTSLNINGSALLRSVSSSDLGSIKPQIRQQELRIRLELYLRSLYRVRSLEQDCVIAVEPRKAIEARAEMIVSAFVSTVGCVRGVGPVLTKLLTNLTKELLAVEFVAEELFLFIRRIVNEYEHGTSFASLAFLSSPENSAETRLVPMVLHYIRFLQSDWKTHERACELERMLSCSLDGNMRRYLKTVEFQSIGHLLEVCQGFRNELQSIELKPSNTCDGVDLCNKPEVLRQAILDLQREVITINGHVLPPVTSRRDLVNLLSQSLNSRSLTATPMKYRDHDDADLLGNIENCPTLISTEISTQPSSSIEDDVVSTLDSPSKDRKNRNRKASFQMATVDLLTRRLLIAASRTGTGGDAYFIVRDLFGDEDVEVVPAKVLPHHVRASRVGSIEIQVRLASVTIKCHGSFDIYPKSLVGACEPLIQLHTTSSETIYLQELRHCDSSSDDGNLGFEDDGSRSSGGMEALVLQEKRTNKTGRRMLSIRPALYEKVQVWNTPS